MTNGNDGLRAFHEAFFPGEDNRFVGSGGEVLVKEQAGRDTTRMEIGDRLIGIGVAHVVESVSRTPGIDSFNAVNPDNGYQAKVAARAFGVVSKDEVEGGFEFGFEPLEPDEFSELIAEVSEGAASIPAETIPKGAMVLSFLHDEASYTLAAVDGSPGANWARATAGTRHWNVGVAGSDDFWWASFPSDDIGLLTALRPYEDVGSIRFGLSLLPGSEGFADFDRVTCTHPSGATTSHHFCLSGTAAGTAGLETPFPIGLRTQIVFRPRAVAGSA